VVTAVRNGLGQSLAELHREATRDVTANARGTITYDRVTPRWFVISGFVAGRIFYQRSFLARGGTVIVALWIEFPPGLKPCLEGPVAMMSLSFREPGAP
jgi:hypothetical protein